MMGRPEASGRWQRKGIAMRSSVSIGLLLALSLGAAPGLARLDGYHTPFRTRQELQTWWNTVSGRPGPVSGQRKDAQGEGDCTAAFLPKTYRQGLARLFETLKFLHGQNVIKREFPDLTGQQMTSIRGAVIRLLIEQGERVVPSVLGEWVLEVRFPGRREEDAKIDSYVRRHLREYVADCRLQIQELEDELAKVEAAQEAERIKSKIQHVRSGLQSDNMEQLRSQLAQQLRRAGLLESTEYRQMLETVLVSIGAPALPCLFEASEDVEPEVREGAQKIIDRVLDDLLRLGTSGELQIKARLPKIVRGLSSRYEDNRRATFKRLAWITGKRKVPDDETAWRRFLAEEFAPELKDLLLPREPSLNSDDDRR